MITGFTGSLMVISVNAWMNHPGGFRLVGGKVVDVNPLKALFGNRYLWSELIHMYIAGYMVTGFIVAGCYAFGRLRGRWGPLRAGGADDPADDRLPGRAGAGAGRRLDRARHRRRPADQAGGDRGAVQDDRRRLRAPARLVHRRPGQVRDRDPPPAVAAGLPQLGRARPRPGHRPGGPAPAGQRRPASRFRRWSGSARCWRCSGVVYLVVRVRRRRLPAVGRGSTGRSCSPGRPRRWR